MCLPPRHRVQRGGISKELIPNLEINDFHLYLHAMVNLTYFMDLRLNSGLLHLKINI